MRAFRRLIDAIEAEGSAALVTLARVEGSSPREAGARMVVRPSGGFHGTIGGGALELAALDAAQAALESGPRAGVAPLAGARARAWRNAAAGGSNGGSKHSTRAISTIFRLWRSPKAAARRRSGRAWGRTVGSSGRSRAGRATRSADRRVCRATRAGSSRSGRARARSICSAPATSDGRSRSRSRRCRSRCAGSIRGATRFPAHAPANVALIHRAGAGRGARQRARRRAGRRHDPFARARSRDRRRGAQRRALRLCRPDRLGDQAGAVPEPDAGGRPAGGRARPPRLPDRGRRASNPRIPR